MQGITKSFTFFCLTLLAATSGRAFQSYNGLVIIVHTPEVIQLQDALVSHALYQVPLEEIVKDVVDKSDALQLSAKINFSGPREEDLPDGGMHIGRPAYLSLQFQGNVATREEIAEIWQKIAAQLGKQLTKSVGRVYEETQRRTEDRRELLKVGIERLEDKLQEKALVALQFESSGGASLEELRSQAHALRQSAFDLQLQLAALEARKIATEDSIAELTQQTREYSAQDEIGRQLEELVRLRERHVERIASLAEANAISESEIDAARIELTKAKVDLLRHRSTIIDASAARRLASLREQLTNIFIEMAESRAKLKLLMENASELSKQTAKQAELSQTLDALRRETAAHRSALERLRSRLADLEENRPDPPIVRVLPWSE